MERRGVFGASWMPNRFQRLARLVRAAAAASIAAFDSDGDKLLARESSERLGCMKLGSEEVVPHGVGAELGTGVGSADGEAEGGLVHGVVLDVPRGSLVLLDDRAQRGEARDGQRR